MSQLDDADNEITNSSMRISGPVKISAPSTFGRLHVLPLIPDLLALYPDLVLDLLLSDIVRDMVEDRVELAARVDPVDEPDAVVRCIAGMPMVCVGSGKYFRERGTPQVPADLVDHNCLVYGGLREADWLYSLARMVPSACPSGATYRPTASKRSKRASWPASASAFSPRRRSPRSFRVRASWQSSTSSCRTPRTSLSFWPNRWFVPARVRRATEFLA